MAMDWNWYFSTLAQSTAAIVGIFAAFIITKIVSNQITFSQKKRELKSLLLESENLGKKASTRYYSWYNNQMQRIGLRDLDKLLKDSDSILSAEEYYEKISFSPYDSKDEILKAIQLRIDERERKRERMAREIPDFVFPGVMEKLTEEREMIDALRIEIEQHIKRITHFVDENSQNPESSKLLNLIIGFLIVLFYAGVICPLGFLPYDNSNPLTISINALFDVATSFKGFLLIIVSFVFSAMLVIFMVINNRLKYKGSELKGLKEYTDISIYSIHLFNYRSTLRSHCASKIMRTV